MKRRLRPTSGLSVGERRVFWRLRAAIGDINAIDVDADEHCREIAKTVVKFRAKAVA